MKYYKKRVISTMCIICFVIMLLLNFSDIIPKAHAAKEYDWKKWVTGKIVDIDPMFYDGEAGMMFHIGVGSWLQVWNKNWEGRWPGIGAIGTMYSKKQSKGDEHWKWVTEVPIKKRKIRPKVKIKKVSEIKIVQKMVPIPFLFCKLVDLHYLYQTI